MHYFWRAVDYEVEVLEVLVTKHRDRAAALKIHKGAMKRYGSPEAKKPRQGTQTSLH